MNEEENRMPPEEWLNSVIGITIELAVHGTLLHGSALIAGEGLIG